MGLQVTKEVRVKYLANNKHRETPFDSVDMVCTIDICM